MRIEPPPSFPAAIGTMPAATAAAAPPLEPPGVRVRSQGLLARPNSSGSVTARIANSGRLVLPKMTRDAGVILHAVLDQEGDAAEGAIDRATEPAVQLPARLLLHQPHDGVHAAVHAAVLGQRQVQQFTGADLARGDMLGEGGGVAGEVVVYLHGVPILL
jgi:hypothetical protein